MARSKHRKPYRLPRTNSNATRRASAQRERRAMARAANRKKIFVKARELLREHDSNLNQVYDTLSEIIADPECHFPRA